MKILNEEKGLVMVLVLIVLFVITLFSTTMWTFSMTHLRQSFREENKIQAEYLAKSGAEAAIAAWLQKPHSGKPLGTMERVYFDTNSKNYTLNSPDPSNDGGYFDVTLTVIDDESDPKHGLTVIESTGTYRETSHTIIVTTFPFNYGHDLDPSWYDYSSGNLAWAELGSGEDLKLVRFACDEGEVLKLGTEELGTDVAYEAEILSFESDLVVDMNLVLNTYVFYDFRASINGRDETISLVATTIIFENLQLGFLPERTYSSDRIMEERIGQILLDVPPGKGIDGSTNSDLDNSKVYGRVYFDGDDISTQEYQWNRRRWLFFWWEYGILTDGSPQQISHPEGGNLAGREFYFPSSGGDPNNRVNLLDLQPGDLIEIPSGEARAIDKNLSPFLWE